MENVSGAAKLLPEIKPISTLLIANRGEIARRIMRTAQSMGISTVAVYADGDADAPFVQDADTAIALDGRTSAETYLNINKLIAACHTSGADAVHPGYGFLSENASFARAVIDAGLTWVGPTPEVIESMGDKLSAKKIMTQAGVPTLPAIEITPETNLAIAAQEIGYPVLIKASAGGGGRGMRVVADEQALTSAIESAKREAAGAFGDDTVFMEKWLDQSRHIEIQIMGDQHGNLVHCFERECSIQRRHQKIIEEAPSSAVSPEIRQAMGDAALNAARSLGYSSAGTVEFMLSDSGFYFLEVNARLQVEHPVTEAIIGHDLVREQLRVAEGEPLSFTQDELTITGHAIEARLCAEDPERDFLPSPGTVVDWSPSKVADARFDSGIESGSVINTEFDPMLAKIIVWAPSRREAAARLARALETTHIQGLTTNRDFLIATLRHPAFLKGDTTTDFIDRCAPRRTREISEQEFFEAAMIAAMTSQALNRASAKVMGSIRSGWRNSMMPFEEMSFSMGDQSVNIAYRSARDQRFRVKVNEGPEVSIKVFSAGEGKIDLEIDGHRTSVFAKRHNKQWFIHGNRGDLTLTEVARYPDPSIEQNTGGLFAPMPGVVLSTSAVAGQTVEKGDLLLILEAMKMEHRITAPADGIVATIHVSESDQVDNGQLLVTLE